MTHDRNSSYESEIEQTQAQSVTYCPKCGCPVVVAQGAMESHMRRVIHVPAKKNSTLKNL